MRTDWNLWKVYGPDETLCWITLPVGQSIAEYAEYEDWPEHTAFECKGVIYSVLKDKAEEVLSVFSGVVNE